MSGVPDVHEARLDRVARRLAGRLRRRTRRHRSAWPRPLRALGVTAGRWLRQLRDGIQRHWDVGVFDLVFGSVKAFGIYPWLFAMGLAWTIPLAEYAPLNTQLWTAGYCLVRGRIASALGRLRYGYPLDRLEARRTSLVGAAPAGRSVHHLTLAGRVRALQIERRPWRRLLRRLRGEPAPQDAVTIGELRRAVRDPELRLEAGRLGHNRYLYERVLLHLALADPAFRPRLEARLGDPARLRGLARELSRDGEAVEASLVAEADDLRAQPLGGPARPGLRWLHAAYQRRVRHATAELSAASHRLLAHLEDRDREGDGAPDRCLARLRRALHAARLRRDRWIALGRAFLCRVRGARREPGRRTLARECAIARALGVRSRRTDAVLRWAIDARAWPPSPAACFGIA